MKLIMTACLIALTGLTASTDLNWGLDFEAAKVEAASKDQTVLIVFSGSDWCKPCIQLHKELFETESFKAYADDHLTLVKADFPYRKKNRLSKEQTAHNEKLAARYNPDGEFPLAVFTDPSGNILGSFGFDKGNKPEDYVSEFKKYLK